MERVPRSEPKIPIHVAGEVAMRASLPIELIPNLATPPDLITGPLGESSRASRDKVWARNAEVKKAAIAEATRKGVVIPAR